MAGNSLLNTMLWFNRVARTAELSVSQNNGTPGTRNSRFEANFGPAFAQFQHQPAVPAVGTTVTVSVPTQDPQGVTNCQVFWSAAGGAFSNAPMTPQPGGLFVGALPGYAAGTIVQFYVRTVDGPGAVARNGVQKLANRVVAILGLTALRWVPSILAQSGAQAAEAQGPHYEPGV